MSKYQDWPPHVYELLSRTLQATGRVGASKIYAVPDLAAAIAAGAAVDSAPQTVRFREPGIVLAMYGQEVTATAAKYASTRARVQLGANEEFATDGSAGVYVSFLALFGGAQNWWPMMRRVIPGVDWIVTYQNRDANASALPNIYFGFLGDDDVARYASGKS